jgi:hypothetical protein
MSHATTILFGLPGVAVDRVERAADEDGDAVRLAHVKTVVSSAAGCPKCGVISASVKQYRSTRPRDLPYGEEPLAVRCHKRQYRCLEETCTRIHVISLCQDAERERVLGFAGGGSGKGPIRSAGRGDRVSRAGLKSRRRVSSRTRCQALRVGAHLRVDDIRQPSFQASQGCLPWRAGAGSGRYWRHPRARCRSGTRTCSCQRTGRCHRRDPGAVP